MLYAGGHLRTRLLPSARRVRYTWCRRPWSTSTCWTVIFEERNTVLITLWMLGKSRVVTLVLEDADEDDEDDDVVEEGRLGLTVYAPRLIVVSG
jgi:hypothetical protein